MEQRNVAQETWSEVSGYNLNTAVQVGLTEKVKFEQRPQEGEGVSHGYLGEGCPKERYKGPGAEVNLTRSKHSSRFIRAKEVLKKRRSLGHKMIWTDHILSCGPP